MNDHLGKPFELDQLVELLLHHTRSAAMAHPPASEPAPARAAQPEVVFDEAGGLRRFGGDTGQFVQVLQSFAEEVDQLPTKLQSHLERGQWDLATRSLHTLKGLAGTVGAQQLAACAAKAEQACKTNPAALDPQALLHELHSAIRASLAAIATGVQRLSAPVPARLAAQAPVGAGAQDALEMLQRLQNLLERSDMGALSVLERLKQSLPASGPERAALQDLETSMAVCDFSSAALHCRALIDRSATRPVMPAPAPLPAQQSDAGAPAR